MYITDEEQIKTAVLEMLTKTSKGYKSEALNTDADNHTENNKSPQYVDILDVTYITMGRMIGQRQVFMCLCISFY